MTKRCTKCSAEFPATTEYFYAEKLRRDGLRPDCKTCVRSMQLSSYATHRHKRLASAKTYKAEHPERTKANRARYSAEHREENKARCAKWYAENRDRQRETMRRNYEANRAERIASSLAWCQRNRTKVRAAKKRYKVANPEKAAAHKMNRRARESGGKVTAVELAAQRERQQGRCYYCRERIDGKGHMDHVTPLARGGSNTIANIVLACVACNLSKNAKSPSDFAGRLL